MKFVDRHQEAPGSMINTNTQHTNSRKPLKISNRKGITNDNKNKNCRAAKKLKKIPLV